MQANLSKKLLIAALVGILGYGSVVAWRVNTLVNQLSLSIGDIRLPSINQGFLTIPFSLIFQNPTAISLPIKSIVVELFRLSSQGWVKIGESIQNQPFTIVPGTSKLPVKPVIELKKINPFTSIDEVFALPAVRYKVVTRVNIKGVTITDETPINIPL